MAKKTKALVKTEKKILITGGTGFLGTHIVRQLLAAGEKNLVVMASRVPAWMTDAGVTAIEVRSQGVMMSRRPVRMVPRYFTLQAKFLVTMMTPR